MRTFKKHEKYRPIVKILKLKGNIPTVIQVSGRRYVLEHENQRK